MDESLLAVAGRYHRSTSLPLGKTTANVSHTVPPTAAAPSKRVRVAVVGAHLTGQPLNHQLTARGGRLVRTARTADCYRLYALSGTTPAKPGLVRVEAGAGSPVEIEVWSLDPGAFGAFVAEIPPPLGIGTILLEDGTSVKGFLCEGVALQGARDITAFGGWRAYLASL